MVETPPDKGTAMRLSVFATLLTAFVLTTAPALADAPSTMEGKITIADQIDAQAKQLQAGDQKIIGQIQKLVAQGNSNALSQAHAKDLAGKIKDGLARAQWREIVYMAMGFAAYHGCFERGFWFTLYVGSWCKDSPRTEHGACRELHTAHNENAQAYIVARGSKPSQYACQNN